jgi:pimeloyl-ACP methyl ester carboxylesterase
MQTEFVQAGHVQLQVFCHGSGPNVLVLVHGYRASGRVWRLVQESLDEQRFRTIAINNVGAGESDRPNREEDYTFEAFAANLWDAVAGLGLRTFTLVGASMGALTVTRFALDHPEALNALVLLDPAPLDGRTRAVAAAPSERREDDLDTPGVPEDFRLALQADVDNNPAERLAGGLKSIAGARLREHLGGVTMPVLVIGGDRDTAVGVENILAEYRALPEATRSLHIFHGVGHSPNITVPGKLAEVLDQFVTGVANHTRH